MPIYEYHCDSCQAEFQELVFTKAEELEVKCKSCGSSQITKLMSGAAVRMGASSSSGPQCEYKSSGACPGGACGCH